MAIGLLTVCLSSPLSGQAAADTYADVDFVRATHAGDGQWRFDVTVSHTDTGWDNYADRWQVVDPTTDTVLGERVLLHPHVNEQPFTRSLGDVPIPPDVHLLVVRARTNVTAYHGRQVEVDLRVAAAERFAVERGDAPEARPPAR